MIFKSKRNDVELVDNYIVKNFKEKFNLQNEVLFLKLLKQNNLPVPSIISVDENLLKLEYINGKLFLDEFISLENNNLSPTNLVDSLILWIENFYKITYNYFGEQYILYDINFRNFIINNNILYGIDFEQCKKGEIEEDIGRISAFSIMYDPIKTEWKMNFLKEFLSKSTTRFKLDKEKIDFYYNKELSDMENRRRKRL